MQVGEIKETSPGHPMHSQVAHLLFNDVALLRHVKTIQELGIVSMDSEPRGFPVKMHVCSTHLTDILVSDTADLLDVGGGLGHTLEGVTGEDELILDVGGGSDVDIGLGSDATDVLLTEEVADNKMLALLSSHFGYRGIIRESSREKPQVPRFHTGSPQQHGQSRGWARC